jgi:hypothetical protein
MITKGSKVASNLLLSSLSKYHPVVIEGMGSYDPRDPDLVASQITSQLRSHLSSSSSSAQQDKPLLLLTQGDPLEERGISAITPRVASQLQIPRGLVVLDEHIADYHSPNADRQNVVLEFQLSDMVNHLQNNHPSETNNIVEEIEFHIDRLIQEKNDKRKELGKPPLKDYFRHFALLQEVTKATSRLVCDGITVAHTADHISEFSVTSFYEVGLDLGLYHPTDMVSYGGDDDFDFDALEKVRYGQQ